jgi:hypothetical protein
VKKLQFRFAGVLGLLTLATSAWTYAQQPEAASPETAATARPGIPSAETVTRILGQISEITGLKLKHPVPMSTFTKEEWRRWVDDRVRESAKPEEILVEEKAMKMFGFLPPDFDLRAATVDLMTEQAAAVYDQRKKRMIFVQGATSEEMEDAVLVHELSHALADQHFDMRRFLEKGPRSDESESARMAVVEGQAMWIMIEAMLNRSGQSLTKNSAVLEAMLPSMGKMAASQYPVFEKSPLYMKESLLFPYSAGLAFQQAVIDKLGRDGIAAVLRDPPKNTQQVLHPEKYLAHEPVVAGVELPEFDGRTRMKKLTEGDVGEFDFHVLFQQYASRKDADEVAPAWRAGRFELLEEKGTKHPVLRWAVLWASPESAHRALSLYLKAMEKKSQGLQWTRQGVDGSEGSNQYGSFRIDVVGSRLEGVEGLP